MIKNNVANMPLKPKNNVAGELIHETKKQPNNNKINLLK